MKNFTYAALAASAAVLSVVPATPAAAVETATITLCGGGGCAPQPGSNVLIDHYVTGTTITGSLNNAPGTIFFTSTEALQGGASGQAVVSAVDGLLDHAITISYDGGLISALELSVTLTSIEDITFTFIGGNSDGVVLTGEDLKKNNVFNIFDGTFSGVTVGLLNGATIDKVAQVRVDVDNSVSSVPEPASWAMMLAGFGLVGAGMRSRRRTIVTA